MLEIVLSYCPKAFFGLTSVGHFFGVFLTVATIELSLQTFVMLYIILGIAVLLALLAAVIAHRPDYFCITRSLAIRAEASDVFAYINDFHLWGQWSPWEKMDANLQREYSGSAQ